MAESPACTHKCTSRSTVAVESSRVESSSTHRGASRRNLAPPPPVALGLLVRREGHRVRGWSLQPTGAARRGLPVSRRHDGLQRLQHGARQAAGAGGWASRRSQGYTSYLQPTPYLAYLARKIGGGRHFAGVVPAAPPPPPPLLLPPLLWLRRRVAAAAGVLVRCWCGVGCFLGALLVISSRDQKNTRGFPRRVLV